MFKAILIASLMLVIVSAQRPLGPPLRPPLVGLGVAPAVGLLVDNRPEPYNFGFDASDEFGTHWSRHETADTNGAVKGSYGYKDASGLFRTVEYLADDVLGFRANVQSNEPGLVSSAPAGATYNVAAIRK